MLFLSVFSAVHLAVDMHTVKLLKTSWKKQVSWNNVFSCFLSHKLGITKITTLKLRKFMDMQIYCD